MKADKEFFDHIYKFLERENYKYHNIYLFSNCIVIEGNRSKIHIWYRKQSNSISVYREDELLGNSELNSTASFIFGLIASSIRPGYVNYIIDYFELLIKCKLI